MLLLLVFSTFFNRNDEESYYFLKFLHKSAQPAFHKLSSMIGTKFLFR